VLNVEETVLLNYYYNSQKDFHIKVVLYISSVILLLDLVRSQISEVELLQLVPGYYLFLLFLFLFLSLAISTYILRLPFGLDNKSEFGIKTITRVRAETTLHLSGLVIFLLLTFSLNTIIPLALDSFDSYDQETLTDLWSFDQVLSLESNLIIVLLVLSQLSTIFLFRIDVEFDFFLLLKLSKDFAFLSFIMAGVLTPTIDGYTQVTLAFAIIILYSLVLYIGGKNIYIKLNNTSSLSF
jgi:hypothetical protein